VSIAVFDTNALIRAHEASGLATELTSHDALLVPELVRLELARQHHPQSEDEAQIAKTAFRLYVSLSNGGDVAIPRVGFAPLRVHCKLVHLTPRGVDHFVRSRAMMGALSFTKRGSVPGLDDQEIITVAAEQARSRACAGTLISNDKDACTVAMRRYDLRVYPERKKVETPVLPLPDWNDCTASWPSPPESGTSSTIWLFDHEVLPELLLKGLDPQLSVSPGDRIAVMMRDLGRVAELASDEYWIVRRRVERDALPKFYNQYQDYKPDEVTTLANQLRQVLETGTCPGLKHKLLLLPHTKKVMREAIRISILGDHLVDGGLPTMQTTLDLATAAVLAAEGHRVTLIRSARTRSFLNRWRDMRIIPVEAARRLRDMSPNGGVRADRPPPPPLLHTFDREQQASLRELKRRLMDQ